MIDYEHRARQVLAISLAGQRDRSGRESAENHSHRVTAYAMNSDEYIVALLHDVVEDSDTTLEDLAKLFPPHIVAAVDALTRRPDEQYFDYIRRVVYEGAFPSNLVINVKRYDILDNVKRIDTLPLDEQASMLKRYAKALGMLDHEIKRRVHGWSI